ncbi:leucine carboxyl methyltransferase, partial [Acinetobacter ursingii]
IVQQTKQFFENVRLENSEQHLGDLVWMIKASNS